MDVIVHGTLQYLEIGLGGVTIKVKDMRLVDLELVGDEVAIEGADGI